MADSLCPSFPDSQPCGCPLLQGELIMDGEFKVTVSKNDIDAPKIRERKNMVLSNCPFMLIFYNSVMVLVFCFLSILSIVIIFPTVVIVNSFC